MMKILKLICGVVLLACAPWLLAEEDLVTLIREGNRNSREAIRSIHARYDVTQEIVLRVPDQPPRKPAKGKAEWWQDGTRIRCSLEMETILSDEELKMAAAGKSRPSRVTSLHTECLIDDHERTSTHTQRRADGTSQQSASIAQGSQDAVMPYELWGSALFMVQAKPYASLADLLQTGKLKHVEAFEDRGNRFYKLLVTGPPPLASYDYEFVVDPRHNFLITKKAPRTSSDKATLRIEDEVLSFQECAPGIYFPAEVQSTWYALDKDKHEERRFQTVHFRFQSVQVNESIDPQVFALKIAPGTPVVDQRNKKSFVQGEDGKPSGEVKPAPEPAGVTVAQPTYLEPDRGWSMWTIAIGCLFVFAIFVFTGIVYRRQ